jgi:glycosyl-4,4'-diaponeurosporenoate acyltransferase
VLVDLPLGRAIVVSCLAWVLIGLVTGFFVHRLPLRRLDHDNWLTRPRRFESSGRFYEHRLHIRSWKDKLPEKGDLFRGGFSKRHIRDRSDAFLERFAAETRRAEIVHWMNAASGPLFLVWCPWYLGLIMVAFGWLAHLPFICIQRYNRARIERTLERRGRRAGVGERPAGAPASSSSSSASSASPSSSELYPNVAPD